MLQGSPTLGVITDDSTMENLMTHQIFHFTTIPLHLLSKRFEKKSPSNKYTLIYWILMSVLGLIFLSLSLCVNF
jgi:hypothetical protein